MHAVVARSTFRSQNVKSTRGSDHYWRLRCRKSARRCGAKHIFEVKMHKTHHGREHFWRLRCRKKCTPLWREAHFEVKMYKALHVRATFGGSDVEKVHAVVARSTFRSQNVKNTRGSDHYWRLRCRKVHAVVASRCTKHKGFGPLLEVQMSLRFKTLHYRTLHYTTLQYTTLHYITLQYTPLY